MSKFFAVLKLVLLLLPLVKEMVVTIEAQFPEGGQGAKKLEMVRGILEKTFDVVNELDVAFEQVWPIVSTVISSVVALKNATGEFRK